MPSDVATPLLLCRSRARICALAVQDVVEVLRPLPVSPLGEGLAAVRGVAVIRGTPMPVLDLAELLGDPPRAVGRWVVLRVGEQRAVLAVDDLLGIRSLAEAELLSLPPLVEACAHDAVQAFGTLDRQLVVLLSAARIAPEAVWAEVSGP